MKTKNLFLSLFACAAICACNKEAQPEVPQVLGEDAYIQVNIVTPSDATKAGTDGGFDVGTENDVENVLFAFYTAAGKLTEVSTDVAVKWPDPDVTSENPQVEKISNATVVLKGKTITPRQMVVILNYDPTIEAAVRAASDLTALNDVLSNVVSTTINEKTCFVMSNSSYWANGKNAYATQISESHIYSGSTPPSGYKPVDVYVERLAAKVTASGTPEGTINSLELNDGTTLYYYPVIEGYAMTSTAKKSHLIKNITDYSFTNWGGNWNDVANFRSYWANTVGTEAGDFTYLKYSEIGTNTSMKDYYHENTNTAHLPTLIVNAKICKASDASTRTSESIGNLVKYGPTYYMESEFLSYVAQLFVNEGITINGNNAVAADFEIVPVSGYTSKVDIASGKTPGDEVEADNMLENFNNLLYWKGGESYFFTEVAHLGTDAGVNDKGLVRNHAYNITVTSVVGLGTPFLPGVGGGEDPIIDPEKPTDLDYELQAKINILKWKVVNQEVELN